MREGERELSLCGCLSEREKIFLPLFPLPSPSPHFQFARSLARQTEKLLVFICSHILVDRALVIHSKGLCSCFTEKFKFLAGHHGNSHETFASRSHLSRALSKILFVYKLYAINGGKKKFSSIMLDTPTHTQRPLCMCREFILKR